MLFSVKEALRIQAEKDVTIAGFSLVSGGIPQSSPLAAVPEGGPQTECDGMDLERSIETPSPVSRSQSVDRTSSTFYFATPPSEHTLGGNTNTLSPSPMRLGPSPLPSPRPGRRAMSTSVLPDPGKLLVPPRVAGERLAGRVQCSLKVCKPEHCLESDRIYGFY